MRAWRHCIRVLGISLWASLACHGQVAVQPRQNPTAAEFRTPTANLRVDTNLVLVPVTVCDPLNRPVTGLETEHFKVFDDHVEQTVTHFAMDDEPVAVGLVFDISGSMGPKLRLSRMAAAAFFKTANEEDEFFLVEFNDQPKMVVPLTRDVEEVQNQLTFAQSKGRTALLDAIFLSLHEMKKSTKNKKALLIISDGGDNSSRYTEGEVKNLVRESDVLIYAIGVFEPDGSRGRTPEEAAGPGLLNDIAEQTGGRHFPASPLK
jgi:Ca-activated chloride channel family protein